jgi:transcriptional regulator with XRE-family HTH domain
MLEKSDKRSVAATFRDRLAMALAISGLSRAGLARAIGVDRSSVTQMLAPGDTRMPGGHVVAACAQALDVSADWLLGADRPAGTGGRAVGQLAVDLGNGPRDGAR